uniref:Glycosyltransferase n=1 Tax=Araucaria cunninghamii TaxID=56994 RepID=A0A0D6QXC0_ARACU
MDMSGCMPHAVLLPFPGQGHINPLMRLASKLVLDGFIVTFVQSDFNYQRTMQSHNDRSLQCNMLRMISIPDGLPPEDGRQDLLKLMQAVGNAMGPSVIDRLIQDINKEGEHKITCIIADVSLCSGLNEVAKLHDISLAAFQTSHASKFALHYFSSRLVSLGRVNSDGTPKEDKLVKYLPSLPPLYPGELPWLYGGEYRFRLGIRQTEATRPIKWILFNSLYELEAPAVDDLSKEVGVYPIGPLIPSEFLDSKRTTTKGVPTPSGNEGKCLEWLNKQSEKSVIYVAFGSIAVLSKSQAEEFAVGLEATQRPFLWVVRSDQIEGDKSIVPPGFLERTRDRGCVVPWVPQLEVLSHPSVACFVTHCGWNSVQESIAMGVPMLCWPKFTDQFLNRKYIVDIWKIGLPLNANADGIVEKGEFTEAVARLLVGEESVKIGKEVSKWKKIASDAVKEGGSSFNNYNLFVNDIKKLCNP